MVAGAASLAQRARWRSTPLLASASAKAPSSSRRLVCAAPRSFSILAAASASPKTASSVGTLAYNSATFTRFSVAYPAQSTLLTGKPFSSSIAYRRLSFWPSSSKSQTTTDASTVMSELGDKKDEAVSAASELKISTESTLEEAGRSFQDGLHSAQETASDAASKFEPKASELSTSLKEQFSNVDPTTASTVTEAFSGAMGVKAGELAELGLNHWASPPGWIINLLETVGTTTGLPWWGTIVVTTVALRLFIAPLNIAGQKNAVRLANIQPEMKRNMDNIKHFKAAGDQMQMQKAVMDIRKFMSDNNASPIKSFAPLLVQLPLMFSYFVALERIAKSGSESFAHGGPSWCPDLTIADPTYILPAISTLATFAVAEFGFRSGTTGQSNPEQAQLVKYIFRGSIPIMAYISTTFPSGVLVYWATTNVISLIQLGVLQIPVVRQWAKFPKRIRHPKNPYQQESKGFMDKLKTARDRLSDSSTVLPVAKPVASSTNTIPTSMSASESRSDALKEILDDKTAYEATTASKADAESAEAAQRNRERVLKARKRRARQ